jgi:hypothetical protein
MFGSLRQSGTIPLKLDEVSGSIRIGRHPSGIELEERDGPEEIAGFCGKLNDSSCPLPVVSLSVLSVSTSLQACSEIDEEDGSDGS